MHAGMRGEVSRGREGRGWKVVAWSLAPGTSPGIPLALNREAARV